MPIRTKAKVRCLDGEAGEVSRLIVSQTAREITHFVVQTAEGEVVVPLDERVSVRPTDVVNLDVYADHLKKLPAFHREDYKEVELAELVPHVDAFPGEALTTVPPAERDISRRRFFGRLGALLGTIPALALVYPIYKYIRYPMYQGLDNRWIPIGTMDRLAQVDVPRLIRFPKVTQEAYMTNRVEKAHWGIRASASLLSRVFQEEGNRVFKDEAGQTIWENKDVDVIVYSGKCPHLGCAYRWEPPRNRFVCPCHISVFLLDGVVVSGPAPRRLDTLPVKVEGKTIKIIDAEYKAAVHEKVRIA